MRPAGSSSALQRRRERAIELLQDGHQPCDVAANDFRELVKMVTLFPLLCSPVSRWSETLPIANFV
jgi:hypothetical protein